jgi:Holliday junction resolvase RusA-like endonuclease
VALAVAREMANPWGGPLHVGVTFSMPRPKGHYGSGRNADKVKASAPPYPVGRPDLDNLVKAVLDALRGIAWGDDTQVVSLRARKTWAEPSPGAVIVVREVVR